MLVFVSAKLQNYIDKAKLYSFFLPLSEGISWIKYENASFAVNYQKEFGKASARCPLFSILGAEHSNTLGYEVGTFLRELTFILHRMSMRGHKSRIYI